MARLSIVRTTALPLALTLAVGLAGCGDDADPETEIAEADQISFRERMTTIDDAVAVWAGADTIETAHAAAEAAANLVVGAAGPGYGDRDGNGVVDGETAAGVLPGLDGNPAGVAAALAANACIDADVLGGSWDDPADRWATMATAIDAWTTDDNTMVSLPSQPMRIVGWATLALASESLDEVENFGRRAAVSVDESLDALDCDQ